MAKKGKLLKVAKGLQSKKDSSGGVSKKKQQFAEPSSKKGNAKPTTQRHIQTFGATLEEDNVILLVGEGNFSFAASLAEKLRTGSNIIATCYDAPDILHAKYNDALERIKLLEDYDASVVYGVDATALEKEKTVRDLIKTKMERMPDRIIFNFPHVGMGIKDQDRNIRANQELLLGFFQSCSLFLNQFKDKYLDSGVPCQVWVTLKTGTPYDQWDVKALAKSAGFKTMTSFPFEPSSYPGYVHRRTLGFKDGLSLDDNLELQKQPCRTFVFIKS